MNPKEIKTKQDIKSNFKKTKQALHKLKKEKKGDKTTVTLSIGRLRKGYFMQLYGKQPIHQSIKAKKNPVNMMMSL